MMSNFVPYILVLMVMDLLVEFYVTYVPKHIVKLILFLVSLLLAFSDEINGLVEPI